ncbi:MAG: dethiobiotin synthase [Deltaproteobacteria bacterium]|nr:dethiobiotin synthase [Deltaproteobacteria bacterium]
MKFPRAFFVTGTDTGVGKTFVSAVLMTGLANARYWKPVQSGTVDGCDTSWIRAATGLPADRFFPETYRLKAPVSPHLAASMEGVSISLDDFALPPVPENGHLIVEGAGGIMVPLNDRDLVADLVKRLGLPVIVVSRSGLGTINHTLLTLSELGRREIEILGVVMNGPENPENKKAVEYYGRVKVLARIPKVTEVGFSTLQRLYLDGFDAS